MCLQVLLYLMLPSVSTTGVMAGTGAAIGRVVLAIADSLIRQWSCVAAPCADSIDAIQYSQPAAVPEPRASEFPSKEQSVLRKEIIWIHP